VDDLFRNFVEDCNIHGMHALKATDCKSVIGAEFEEEAVRLDAHGFVGAS
jgi:hypothetical protein